MAEFNKIMGGSDEYLFTDSDVRENVKILNQDVGVLDNLVYKNNIADIIEPVQEFTATYITNGGNLRGDVAAGFVVEIYELNIGQTIKIACNRYKSNNNYPLIVAYDTLPETIPFIHDNEIILDNPNGEYHTKDIIFTAKNTKKYIAVATYSLFLRPKIYNISIDKTNNKLTDNITTTNILDNEVFSIVDTEVLEPFEVLPNSYIEMRGNILTNTTYNNLYLQKFNVTAGDSLHIKCKKFMGYDSNISPYMGIIYENNGYITLIR